MKTALTTIMVCTLALTTTTAWAAAEQGDVFSRSTVRSFASTTLAQNDLKELLRAGFSAPSAINQRALEYIVLSNRKEVEKLARVMPQQRSLQSATCVIVIAGNKQKAKAPDILPVDAGLATQAVITEAGRLHLATNVMALWPSTDRQKQAASALEIPSTAEPLLMIAVGIPAADAVTGASQANFQPEQIHRGRW